MYIDSHEVYIQYIYSVLQLYNKTKKQKKRKKNTSTEMHFSSYLEHSPVLAIEI